MRPASSGLDLTCVPTFADIEIDGQRRTAIRLLVERRPIESSAGDGPAGPVVPAGGRLSLKVVGTEPL